MILVAGATGYIGELLTERLLDRGGEPVRILARTPSKSQHLIDRGAEAAKANVLEPETLPDALEGVRAAYYLIHSMGRGNDGDFVEQDLRGAANFGAAAKEAGVERIIYLGGLGDPDVSAHLRSRHETAVKLIESGVPVVYFRAAAVIGSGSESFRTVYYLVKRLPVMLTPKWTANRTQPVAIADVIDYLEQAADREDLLGETIEIGGPEVTTYAGMMDAAAEAIGVSHRRRVTVPVLSPGLSSHWIGLVTPVDADVAKPLVHGLSTDTVVSDPSGMKAFDIEPTPMRVSMQAAVDEVEGR